MSPAPAPRTDADKSRDDLLIEKVQAAIAAKDAEIARLKADGAASAFVDMAIRAEKAEAKLRCADDVLTRNGIPVGSTPGDELVINLIKLFSERDQLRAEVEQYKQDFRDQEKRIQAAHRELAEVTGDRNIKRQLLEKLRADLAAAKVDTERLDWLERNKGRCGYSEETYIGAGYFAHPHCMGDKYDAATTLRAAIDAARKAQP